MKEIIDYGERKCIVFDEPISEYHEIMLIAASDQHRLSPNYRKDILKENDFMTIWTHHDRPVLIYGLQKDPDLQPNIARCFNRYYIVPQMRSFKAKYDVDYQLSFYMNHPEYHEALGVDTLFFTRNVENGTRQEIFLQRYMKKYGFKKIDPPRVYNGCLQTFFVWGNTNFVTELPLSLSGPSM